MTKPKLYGVYTARFPFLETKKSKIRPVIIISAPYGVHNIVAIVPISSKSKREAIDVSLDDWQLEGLLRESMARVHRMTTMLTSDLLADLGSLRKRIRQPFRSLCVRC